MRWEMVRVKNIKIRANQMQSRGGSSENVTGEQTP